MDFSINGDSFEPVIILDNYGTSNPIGDYNPPGLPLEFVSIASDNLSYSNIQLTFNYLDDGTIDASDLRIFKYVETFAYNEWLELPNSKDEINKAVSAETDSGTIFAVSVLDITGYSKNITIGDLSVLNSIGVIQQAGIEIIGTDGVIAAATGVLSIDEVPQGSHLIINLAYKNFILDFTLDNDSLNPVILLEDFGVDNPVGDYLPPGKPVKYFMINAENLGYSNVDLTIHYPNVSKNIGLFRLDETSAYNEWGEITTAIDKINNTISASLNSLSIFALSKKSRKYLNVVDIENKPLTVNINTYDSNKILQKSKQGNKLLPDEMPVAGYIKIDALTEKDVAVTINAADTVGGDIVLDNYGKHNPKDINPDRASIKFVEIHTKNDRYDGAEIEIKYSDDEIVSFEESKLQIAHYVGGEWVILKSIVDKENNIVRASTDSFSTFALIYNGTSVNTKKSIYKPGETAEIVIVTLDSASFPVSDASIEMNVTSSNGSIEYFSTLDGSINETADPGVYEALYLTSLEGKYNISCTAIIEGNESRFDTYFIVQSDYNFDIIRTTLSKIDPFSYEKFNVTINITSNVDSDYITIKEYVPVNFTIYSDANITEIDNRNVLIWQRNLINNKTSVNYSYSLPLKAPLLYQLGPLEIKYRSKIFYEARPWYVAVDAPPTGCNCHTLWGFSLSYIGLSNCIYCHKEGGMSPPNPSTINMSLLNQTPHMNINGGNSTNNMQCYLCHLDGTAPDNKNHDPHDETELGSGIAVLRQNALNKNCASVSCHGNTSISEARFNIKSHSPTTDTRYVRTNSTTAGCENCHGVLSLQIFNETTQGGSGSMVLSNGPVAHYIKDPTDYDNNIHYFIDSVGWEMDGQNGSQGCVYCHRTANGTAFNATNISEKKDWVNHDNVGNDCYICHIVGTTTFHDIGVINASSGGPDCLYCHGTGRPSADVNTSVFNSSIHAILNDQASNSTPLNDTLSKACWACHGNGTEPSGHPNQTVGGSNPSNTTFPLNCTEGKCHVNSTPTGTSISGNQPNITLEHVPNINSSTEVITQYAINCTDCHNNSITSHLEPEWGLANENDHSNVSHYGSKTNLITPTVQCTLCHKNATNGQEWGNATQIRHPAKSSEYTFCDNCHNTTPANDFHNQSLVKPGDIHSYFDYQNDDNNEIPPMGTAEACYACHGGFTVAVKVCEDCHLTNGSGPRNDTGNLRTDFNETVPIVYTHTNVSLVINLKNQSSLFGNQTKSSCFGFNADTLEGSCHAVSYRNRSNASGFYAFYDVNSPDSDKSPYHWTYTIDRMPNTTQCQFCHNQSNSAVRVSWGNATQITYQPGGIHQWYTDNDNSQCWSCHEESGTMPVDFHSANLTSGGGADCVSCHDLGKVALKEVDVSNMNQSGNMHKDLNNGTVTSLNPDNERCWACHGDGTEPSGGHPGNFYTPYECLDCHNNSNLSLIYTNDSRKDNLTTRPVFEHNTNASEIKTAANCSLCHKNSIASYNDPDGGSMAANVSHYGTNTNLNDTVGYTTDGCIYCHLNYANSLTWGNATDLTNVTFPRNHTETTNNQCWICHIDNNVTINSFHNESVNPGWDPECIGCHFLYDYMANKNTSVPGYMNSSVAVKKYVNGTMFNASVHSLETGLKCRNCHTNYNRSEHPPSEYSWRWCEDCHVVQNDPLNETDRHNVTKDPWNYTIGGISVVNITDCTVCHNATLYDNSKSTFNMSSGKECRYCHTFPDQTYN
ncbi:MAG: hypothetical protein E4G94_00110 [ANME-2 cluster archaeon]|nr:MAG: hypothetical protein E4G94_00110 [ANME-2 cluster archaeon]